MNYALGHGSENNEKVTNGNKGGNGVLPWLPTLYNPERFYWSSSSSHDHVFIKAADTPVKKLIK